MRGKRILAALLCGMMVFQTAFVHVSAEENTEIYTEQNTIMEGICGESLTWSIEEENHLRISGTGEMEDYTSQTVPWVEYQSFISSVEIEEGVSSIGSYAFSDCVSLEKIDIPESITAIGDYAFSGCTSLKEIKFFGKAPTFVENAVTFLDVTADVYYPENEGMWLEEQLQKYGGELTWKAYCIHNYDDGVVKEVTCTEDGFTTFTCEYCGDSYISDEIEAQGHSYDDGVVTEPSCKAEGFTTYTCGVCGNSYTDNTVSSLDHDCSYVGLKTGQHQYVCSRCDYEGTEKCKDDNGDIICDLCEERIVLASGECGTNLTWTLYGDYVLVFEGSGMMTYYSTASEVPWKSYMTKIIEVQIPNEVTRISAYAFQNASALKNFVLPKNLVGIGAYAFEGSVAFSGRLELPDSVTNIGEYAFKNCKAITEVVLGENTKYIICYGGSVFHGCDSLKTIHFKNTEVPYITTGMVDNQQSSSIEKMFDNSALKQLEEIVVPTGCYKTYVETYGKYIPTNVRIKENSEEAFIIEDNVLIAYAGSEPVVTVPETVKVIGSHAFLNNLTVQEIIFPEGLTAIEKSAFHGCQALSKINIPSTVVTISERAFYYCASLTDITIPSGVTSLGNYCFYSCTELKTMVLPDTVTSLGTHLFDGCMKLETAVLPKGITAIPEYTFYNCLKLNSFSIPENVTTIETLAFYACGEMGEVTLDENITTITDNAFDTCTISNLRIDGNVTNIGTKAFENSIVTTLTLGANVSTISDTLLQIPTFTEILVEKGNGYFLSDNGVLFDYGQTVLEKYPPKKTGDSYVVPETVKTIDANAFAGNTSLTNITVGNILSTIRANAFSGCTALKKVYYGGTEGDWSLIGIAEGNQLLLGATMYYDGQTMEGINGSGWNGIYASTYIGGSGTETDPYLISTGEQLARLAMNVCNGTDYYGKYFKMTNDIVLNNTRDWELWSKEYAPKNVWSTSIGGYNYGEKCFRGTFDGNNYSVIGLYTLNGGLFFKLAGTVKNLSIRESYVYRKGNPAGAIADEGSNTYGTGLEIINCRNYGKVVGGTTGGIIGAHTMWSDIVNCRNYGDVSGGTVGGIVGRIAYSISVINCYNYGDVHGSKSAGGILGGIGSNHQFITISKCANYGNIDSVESQCGGIAGFIPRFGGLGIYNCYNAGNVTGKENVYGFAYSIDDSAEVRNSYNRGIVSGNSEVDTMGSIWFSHTNCYYLEGSGTTKTGSKMLTEEQFTQQSSFAGFDFNTVWFMDPEFGPRLRDEDISYRPSGSEILNSDEYIIEEVKKYTNSNSDEIMEQFWAINGSDVEEEEKYRKLNELFQNYGLTDMREGIDYLTQLEPYQLAYNTLTVNEYYGTYQLDNWLQNSMAGKAANAVLVADGLVFNGEVVSQALAGLTANSDYRPGVKKNKQMLHEFICGSEMNPFTDLTNIANDTAKIIEELVKANEEIKADEHLNDLIIEIRKSKSKSQIETLVEEFVNYFCKIKTEKGEEVVYFNNSRIADTMSAGGTAIKMVGISAENIKALIDLNEDVLLYKKYKNFLVTVSEAQELPVEMRLASKSLLVDIEEGYFNRTKNFLTDLFEISLEANTTIISEDVLNKFGEKYLEKYNLVSGKMPLAEHLNKAGVAVFVANLALGMDSFTKNMAYTRAYGELGEFYANQLRKDKERFLNNSNAENAWKFFEDYTILWNLRSKGEQQLLSLFSIQFMWVFNFKTWGYDIHEPAVRKRLELLEKSRFSVSSQYTIPESVQYMKKAVINCPVDVYIYNEAGDLIIVLKDGEESDLINEYGRFAVVYQPYTGEYAKVICQSTNEELRYELVALSDGLVDFAHYDGAELKTFDKLNVDKGNVINISEDGYEVDFDADGTVDEVADYITKSTEEYIKVEKVEIGDEPLNMNVGETGVLNVEVLPLNASNTVVTWISLDENVATVQNGVVTAVGPGKTTIIATAVDGNEVSDQLQVIVNELPTPIPTETEEVTPTPTETEVVTPTPTETEAVTPTPTETEEVTPIPTETEVVTPTPTETEEVTPTPTETEVVTPTETEEVKPIPTETEEVTPIPTETEEVTPTPTETEEVTPTPTETEAVTPAPTETEVVTPTPTETEKVTPIPTETEVITPTPTETEEVTPIPTETEEVTPTPTETEVVTPTPTPTRSVTEIFTDVYDDWYTSYVQYVFDHGLMTGIKGTTEFQPNANITKAQVAQVLYNMENQPIVNDKKAFTDLKDVYAAEWYANAVAWAYNTGVVTGDLNTKKFSPNANVTREQLALMLYRYADYKDYNIDQYSDLSGLENAENVSNWAADGVKWAVGAGLISGIDKNGVKDLAPQGNANRAQVAAILQRFCEAYNN